MFFITEFTLKVPLLCEHSWIGDGMCDDANNYADCEFDEGDCCGPNVNKTYCHGNIENFRYGCIYNKFTIAQIQAIFFIAANSYYSMTNYGKTNLVESNRCCLVFEPYLIFCILPCILQRMFV